MRLVKRLVDFSIIILVILAVYQVWTSTSVIVSTFPVETIQEERLFLLVGMLTQVIVGAIASIFAILIAVYVLASQLVGRKPYSRFVRTFYGKIDFVYFMLLFISLIVPVGVLTFWNFIADRSLYFLLDVLLITYAISVGSLLAIMLKHFNIFDAKEVVYIVLRSFNRKNILAYGLVYVEKNNHNNNLKYVLKTWGHRHNLSDPLGPYHDMVMEAVTEKERITFHLYLNVLMEKIANLSGVRYERRFGLAGGKQLHAGWHKLRMSIPILVYVYKIEERIQIAIHALHYLVRRARKLVDEWKIDNHRQIILINLGDLVNALSKRASNAQLIEVCFYAMLRVCLDFRNVSLYGSYEPLRDMFDVAVELKRKGFAREANLCIRVLAYLDGNTSYISENPNFNIRETLAGLPTEMINYYEEQKTRLRDKSLTEGFPNNIWTW